MESLSPIPSASPVEHNPPGNATPGDKTAPAIPSDTFAPGEKRFYSFRDRAADLLLSGNTTQRLSEPVWEFDSGRKAGFVSPPIIVDRRNLLIRDGANLYSIDALTGRKNWELHTNTWDSSPPQTVPGNLLLTATYTTGEGSKISAIDRISGEKRWESETGDATGCIAGSDGTVYFGMNRKNLYALDGKTGELKWKVKNDEYVHVCGEAQNGIIIYNNYDRKTFALSARTGKKLWEHTAESAYKVSQYIHPGGLAVVTSGGIIAIDPASGREEWKKELQGSIREPLFGSDGKMYVTVTRERTSAIYTLDAKSGRELWNKEIGGEVRAPLTRGEGGELYVADDSGNVTALDGETGEEKWKQKVETFMPSVSCPPLSDGKGKLIVGHTHDGNSQYSHEFSILESATGKIEKTYKCPTDRYLEQPHVNYRKDAYDFIGVVVIRTSPDAAGLFFVGTGDGKVVTLGDPDSVKEYILSGKGETDRGTVEIEEEQVIIDGVHLWIDSIFS